MGDPTKRRVYTVLGNLVPKGFQQITIGAAAASLTVPSGARVAVVQCTAQNVRWRDDGTAPTATVGMQLATTDVDKIYDGDLSAIQFFREASGAILNVSYYG